MFAQDLFNAIHRTSPYEGFDADAYPLDLQGWMVGETVLNQLVDQIQPTFIIEVGVWKGTSAFHMIERAKTLNPNAAILCIDTWLGSPEHWLKQEWFDALKCVNGYPTLYQQFLANVIHKGLTDHVVPLPMPAPQAAYYLSQIGLQAPLIHIDGAHDEASVRQDIAAYWPLVLPGGALVGDDYNPGWPGVIAAFTEFVDTTDDIALSAAGDGRWFAQKKG